MVIFHSALEIDVRSTSPGCAWPGMVSEIHSKPSFKGFPGAMERLIATSVSVQSPLNRHEKNPLKS
jgi:hypothetical protein